MTDFNDMTNFRDMTPEKVQDILGFELMHVGINCPDEAAAITTAMVFKSLFGFMERDTDISIFAGDSIEIMKGSARGVNGHIAIGTNSLPMAKRYLENQGCRFVEDSICYKDGVPFLVYMQDEIGGVAVHLIQK